MPAPEASREAPMLEGMIEVKAGVIPPGLVSNPFAIGVNVGSFGMASLVAETVRGRGRRMSCPRRCGPVRRNVSPAYAGLAPRKSRERKHQQHCNKSDQFLHRSLRFMTLAFHLQENKTGQDEN